MKLWKLKNELALKQMNNYLRLKKQPSTETEFQERYGLEMKKASGLLKKLHEAYKKSLYEDGSAALVSSATVSLYFPSGPRIVNKEAES